MYMRDLYIVCCLARDMLYPLSALSVMYILLMYYISLLLLPPDGFVLCYIGLLVLTLWRFDDDIISPSSGRGRHRKKVRSDKKQSRRRLIRPILIRPIFYISDRFLKIGRICPNISDRKSVGY